MLSPAGTSPVSSATGGWTWISGVFPSQVCCHKASWCCRDSTSPLASGPITERLHIAICEQYNQICIWFRSNFTWLWKGLFFFFPSSVLLQGILLNETWNKSKEGNYRLRVILEHLNHLRPLRACFHGATLVRHPFCYLQKHWCFWVAMATAWKTRARRLSMLCHDSTALHFLRTKSQRMGKKGSSKVFLPIFINVSKAEDSLNSVVDSPRASTVMTESLLPYTSRE